MADITFRLSGPFLYPDKSGESWDFILFELGLKLFYGEWEKRNRPFISVQPLNHLCLAYTAGLTFFAQVCILLYNDWELSQALHDLKS